MSAHSSLRSEAQLYSQACSSLNSAGEQLTIAAANISSASGFVANEKQLVLSKRSQNKEKKAKKKITRGKSEPIVSRHFPTLLKEKRTRRAKKVEPIVSPFFPAPTEKKRRTREVGPTMSPHFPFDQTREPFSRIPTPPGLSFQLVKSESPSSLIQERICASLFALVVQAILWNKTKGFSARPILWNVLCKYSTAESLAAATLKDLESEIRTLGLQNERAKRLIDMSKAWVAAPPCPERRYQRLNYPKQGNGRDIKQGECLGPDDLREGWEIAHLPGVGEYALDSFRIFGRDRLRGLHNQPDIEPEWKRLVPRDKELGLYVQWKWQQEDWNSNLSTGARVHCDEDTFVEY